MNQTELSQGLVVVARGQPSTILRCLPDLKVEVFILEQREVVVVGLDEILLLPTRNEDNTSLIPENLIARSSEVDFEELSLARKKFEVLKQYFNKDINLKDAISELGVSASQFYNLRKLYDAESGYVCFLRLKRGRPAGNLLLNPAVEEIIKNAIKLKYEGKAATYSRVWQEVEAQCIETNNLVPSVNTVTLRIKSINSRELHKKKYGEESASQKYDRRPGKKLTTRPLEFAQLDHTLVDVIIVDDVERKPLARPWLSVMIDLHTRVILGYYLSLHAPSALSVACLMMHAAMPKHKFLEGLGLDINIYPFYGVPETIHMDNAAEFTSTKLKKACVRHGIKPEWRPVHKKHYGGHVERIIGTFMTEHVHFLPGTTYSNTVMLSDYDSGKHAALTFKEFTRWFAGEVAIYHNRIHRELGGYSPKSTWINFFTNSDGQLRHPPLVERPLDFKLDFMPELRRQIHKKGVVLSNQWYWSSALLPYVGRRRVEVKFDPFSMRSIWVRIDGEYIKLHFSNVTDSDYTYEEYRSHKFKNFDSVTLRAGALEDRDIVKIIRDNDRLIENSKKQTKAVKKKNAARKEYFDGGNADLQIAETPDKRVGDSHSRPDYSSMPVPFSGKNI